MKTPNYYAIIPASVRYNPALAYAERLLYGEITALSSKEGYCWANNAYFARLYGVTNRTVIRWMNNLKAEGYLYIEYQNTEGTQQLEIRRLFITENMKSVMPPRHSCHVPHDTDVNTPRDMDVYTPRDADVTHNSIKINTTSINNIKESIE